jgi:hypothetical protein
MLINIMKATGLLVGGADFGGRIYRNGSQKK